MSRTTFLALKRESHPINLEPTRTLLLICTAGLSQLRHSPPLARSLAHSAGQGILEATSSVAIRANVAECVCLLSMRTINVRSVLTRSPDAGSWGSCTSSATTRTRSRHPSLRTRLRSRSWEIGTRGPQSSPSTLPVRPHPLQTTSNQK